MIAPKDDNPVVYIVSDSIGETAELVAKAAVSQFNGGNVQIRRVPYVNDPQEIVDIVDEAQGQNCIIAFTLVLPELREVLVREADRHHIHSHVCGVSPRYQSCPLWTLKLIFKLRRTNYMGFLCRK